MKANVVAAILDLASGDERHALHRLEIWPQFVPAVLDRLRRGGEPLRLGSLGYLLARFPSRAWFDAYDEGFVFDPIRDALLRLPVHRSPLASFTAGAYLGIHRLVDCPPPPPRDLAGQPSG